MFKSKKRKELENRVAVLESKVTQLESRVMIDGKKVAATLAAAAADEPLYRFGQERPSREWNEAPKRFLGKPDKDISYSLSDPIRSIAPNS
jgi:hypothetical protein